MEKKIIILILTIILLIILIFSKNSYEYFDNKIIYKPLTTEISNSIYSFKENDNHNLELILFNSDSEYSKIYEYKDIFENVYYNIYFDTKILKYNDGRVKFFISTPNEISNEPDAYKFYKTSLNKLYIKINDQNKYLSLNKSNLNIITLSDNEQEGIIWNLFL
jgi:hypothetical protein